MHIWGESQLLQKKNGAHTLLKAQKYEGTVQFARSGTINLDALIPVNSADHYPFKTRLWNYSSIL